MIIDCISDLHGEFPILDGGDLLIVAGDCSSDDSPRAWVNFFTWLKSQNYRKKIMVAGNHDNFLLQCCTTEEALKLGILDPLDLDHDYLCDSGTEFEGIKIWGSPWSLWFHGIHSKCKAFTTSEKKLKKIYKQIPLTTDILITHQPPFGMLDRCRSGDVGSKTLSERLLDLNLSVHIFGHIHEGYGSSHAAYFATNPWDDNPLPMGHLSINCSFMNGDQERIEKDINAIINMGVILEVEKKPNSTGGIKWIFHLNKEYE